MPSKRNGKENWRLRESESEREKECFVEPLQGSMVALIRSETLYAYTFMSILYLVYDKENNSLTMTVLCVS